MNMKLKVIFLAGLVCAFSVFADEINTANMTEEELVAAAEKLIAQEKEKAEPVEAVRAELTEEQIPAFRGKENKAEVANSPWTRMVLGSGVIVVLALGLLLGAKRFGKKSLSKNSKVIMDIVSQKAVSPKQNLIVVRVAGEHILLGATDHSINMIKTISLIDDESEGSLPQDFNNFLEDEFVHQNISEKKGRAFTI